MNSWVVLQLDLIDDYEVGDSSSYDEAVDSLEYALKRESIDYYITNDPYEYGVVVLIVPIYYIDGRNSAIDQMCDAVGLTYVEVTC